MVEEGRALFYENEEGDREKAFRIRLEEWRKMHSFEEALNNLKRKRKYTSICTCTGAGACTCYSLAPRKKRKTKKRKTTR
jgi:hypothetical protein